MNRQVGHVVLLGDAFWQVVVGVEDHCLRVPWALRTEPGACKRVGPVDPVIRSGNHLPRANTDPNPAA